MKSLQKKKWMHSSHTHATNAHTFFFLLKNLKISPIPTINQNLKFSLFDIKTNKKNNSKLTLI